MKIAYFNTNDFQFLPPQDVLQGHWQRNGLPTPTRLAPPSARQAQRIQPTPVQRIQPAPVQYVPSAPIPPVPTQSTPMRTTTTQQAPVRTTPTKPAPVRPDPIQLYPAPTIPPVVASTPPTVPLTLPALGSNEMPSQSYYPSAWQDLINHASTYILHDMIFSHPFPPAIEGQKWAREALSAAFVSYNRKYDITLDKRSCKFTRNYLHADITTNIPDS